VRTTRGWPGRGRRTTIPDQDKKGGTFREPEGIVGPGRSGLGRREGQGPFHTTASELDFGLCKNYAGVMEWMFKNLTVTVV
jgi:hypothetical protein